MSINLTGSIYTENFDTLSTTGTSSSLPAGWLIAESGTNANATYTAGTGSSTTGNTYSFGSSGSTERALGGLQSGSLVPLLGASFTNTTGQAITGLDIRYRGEQWRLGATGREDRLDFQYSLDATSLTTGTWVDLDELDFVAPVTTTTGALDGNATGNFALRSKTLENLSIAEGATFYLRWTDFDASGGEDGLAIDDFSLEAIAANTPPLLGTTTVLYDPTVGTLPTAQGWGYESQPTSPGITPTVNGAGTNLNTTLNSLFYAGFARADQLLDAAEGYALSFTAQILSENRETSAEKNDDGKDDRAGFSVVVVGSDPSKSLELGFFSDRIWAQEGGTGDTLFTQAESVAFDTSTHAIAYELVVLGDDYTLLAKDTVTNATATLAGSLRDYTAWSGPLDPYETPNFLFIGDNTTSANANVNIGAIALTPSLPPTPPTLLTVEENQPFSLDLAAIDSEGDAVTFELGGTDANQFTLNATTGVLSLKTPLDYENPADADIDNTYAVTVSANDGNGGITTRAFNLQVTDIADTTISELILSNTSINENVPANTIVGDLSFDGGATYELIRGTGASNNNQFQIVGNQLQIKKSPNYEAKDSYSIRVAAKDFDTEDVLEEKVFSITVNDLVDNSINGTSGNDRLLTTNEVDTVNAGTGNDTITGTFENLVGGESFDGGEDTDTLIISGGTSDAFVQIELWGNYSFNDSNGQTGGGTVVGIENVNLSRVEGNAKVFGDGANNVIRGSNGNDELNGGDGNDRLTGGLGNDLLAGGEGNDRLDGGAGRDELSGDFGNDILVSRLEDLADGETFNGGDGTDTLIISGGTPASFVQVELWGNYLFDDGNGQAGGGAVGSIENVNLSRFEGNAKVFGIDTNNVFTGGSGNDELNGGGGNDRLAGGLGEDKLIGGDGSDRLDGGAGRTEIYAGAGNDTLVSRFEDLVQGNLFSGDDGTDTLIISGGIADISSLEINLGGRGGYSFDDGNGQSGSGTVTGIENVNLSSFQGNTNLVGNEANNSLTGGSGDDTLIGEDGNDRLTGGLGSDSLIGGLGNDTLDLGTDSDSDFVFYFEGDGTDTIRNFARGADYDILQIGAQFEVDVVTNGSNTELRQSSVNGFGKGNLLMRIVNVTGFNQDDLGLTLVGTTFNFESAPFDLL